MRRTATDLAVATIVVCLTLPLVAIAKRANSSNEQQIYLVLTTACAGVAAGAAAVAESSARLVGSIAHARVGAALAVFGLFVVPASTVQLRVAPEAVAMVWVQISGALVVAGLLLSALSDGPGRATAWPAAGGAFTLLAVVGLVVAAGHERFHAMVSGHTWAVWVDAGVWAAVAAVFAFQGTRVEDQWLVRVGIGSAVVAGAYAARAGHGGEAAHSDLYYAALRLVGIGFIVCALLGLLFGQMRRHARERAQLLRDRDEAVTARRTMEARDHEMRNTLLGLSGVAHLLFQDGGTVTGLDQHELRIALDAELARLRALLVPPSGASSRVTVRVEPLLQQAALIRTACGMDVAVDAEPGLTALVTPDVLAQVMTNLLTNCDRHAPGAPVRVTSRLDGGIVHIEVTDSGPGLEPGTEEDVFGMGHRSVESPGSGLGLGVSRRLLAPYGGTLRLLSRDRTAGGGCTAMLRVPALLGVDEATPALDAPAVRPALEATPAQGTPQVTPPAGPPVVPLVPAQEQRGATFRITGQASTTAGLAAGENGLNGTDGDA